MLQCFWLRRMGSLVVTRKTLIGQMGRKTMTPWQMPLGFWVSLKWPSVSRLPGKEGPFRICI